MFTGPLQQLLALSENERTAYRQDEGGRLCQAEFPTAPGDFDTKQVLDATDQRDGFFFGGVLTRIAHLGKSPWVESLKSRLARPRRPRAV